MTDRMTELLYVHFTPKGQNQPRSCLSTEPEVVQAIFTRKGSSANVGMHRPGGYIEKCTLLLTSTLAEAVTTATVMTARFISQPPRALCCDALGQKSYRNNPIASEAGQLEADVEGLVQRCCRVRTKPDHYEELSSVVTSSMHSEW